MPPKPRLSEERRTEIYNGLDPIQFPEEIELCSQWKLLPQDNGSYTAYLYVSGPHAWNHAMRIVESFILMMEKQGLKEGYPSYSTLSHDGRSRIVVYVLGVERFSAEDFTSARWFFRRSWCHVFANENISGVRFIKPYTKSVLDRITQLINFALNKANTPEAVLKLISKFSKLMGFYYLYTIHGIDELFKRSRMKAFFQLSYVPHQELEGNRFIPKSLTKAPQQNGFEDYGYINSNAAHHCIYYICAVRLLETVFILPEYFKNYYFAQFESGLHIVYKFSQQADFDKAQTNCLPLEIDHSIITDS